MPKNPDLARSRISTDTSQGVNLSENEKKVLEIFNNALSRPGFIKPGINKNSEYAIKFMSVVVLDSISRSKSRIVTSKLDDELDR